jgi:hypothetical protein
MDIQSGAILGVGLLILLDKAGYYLKKKNIPNGNGNGYPEFHDALRANPKMCQDHGENIKVNTESINHLKKDVESLQKWLIRVEEINRTDFDNINKKLDKISDQIYD